MNFNGEPPKWARMRAWIANLVSRQEISLAGLAAAAGTLPKAESRFLGEFAVGDRVL